jgi:hypothetical protein
MCSFSCWCVASYVLHLWPIPNVLSSFQYTNEHKELVESGRVPMFHAGFFLLPNGRWVGLYYQAFQAHFLNLGEPALTSTPMDRNPQVVPIYRTQSSHHTSSIGWGSQLNWKRGLEWNTIYCTDNIVRNLLCWLMKMGACKSRSLPRYGTQLWNHLEITYVLYYGKGPFPPRNTFDLNFG